MAVGIMQRFLGAIKTNLHLHDTVSDVAAAGSTNADATKITHEVTEISTCTTGMGVLLLPAVVGMRFTIFNNGAGICTVYGSGTDTIDGVNGQTTGVPLTNAKRAHFYCVEAGEWISAQLGVVSA
jgi:hypothetical protein